MPTGQQYGTNVPQTTLTGSVNASATSLSVASSSGWPATPFTACLDIGTSTQEPVDVTAVVGTTWTVTRNIDGTTGFSHAIGATVTHADIGRDFREARTHIDASTSVHGVTGAVVGTTGTQTLAGKTASALIIDNTVPAAPAGTTVAVFSNAGALSTKDVNSTVIPVTPTTTSAVYQKLLAWSYDPVAASAQSSSNSGIIFLARVVLPAPITATNIIMVIQTAGITLTSGQNFAGIYDSTGARKAQTADQSAVWTSTGIKIMAISGGAVALAAGTYYFAVLVVGTTPPQFASSSATSTGVLAAGDVTAPYRFQNAASGQTALPSTLTLTGGSAAPSFSFWYGLS